MSGTSHPGEKPVTRNGRKNTRQTLMQDALKHILKIEDLFNTADYWNRRVREENEVINPDPDGEMAKNWLNLSEELIGLIVRYRPAMGKHFEKYRPKNVAGNNHNRR